VTSIDANSKSIIGINDLTYQAAKTGYISLRGDCASAMTDASQTNKGAVSGYLVCLTPDNTPNYYTLPLDFPDGCTITGIKVWYYQGDNLASMNVALTRVDGAGNLTTLGAVISGGIAPAYGTAVDAGIVNSGVDLSLYGYQLTIQIFNHDAASEIRVGFIRVSYTAITPRK
jgi:hypothetical protein